MFDIITQKAFVYTSIINEEYKDNPEELNLFNHIQPPNELSLYDIMAMMRDKIIIFPVVINGCCTGEYISSKFWYADDTFQRLLDLQSLHTCNLYIVASKAGKLRTHIFDDSPKSALGMVERLYGRPGEFVVVGVISDIMK